MDKCVKEKESLYHLKLNGIDEVIDSFNKFDDNADSYFVLDSERSYLTEYSFETLPQLKELLREIWKDEEYMCNELKTLLVAAMKNKPLTAEEKSSEEQEKREQIPVFIYNF